MHRSLHVLVYSWYLYMVPVHCVIVCELRTSSGLYNVMFMSSVVMLMYDIIIILLDIVIL